MATDDINFSHLVRWYLPGFSIVKLINVYFILINLVFCGEILWGFMRLSLLHCLFIHLFIYICFDSWVPDLFKGFQSVTIIIHKRSPTCGGWFTIFRLYSGAKVMPIQWKQYFEFWLFLRRAMCSSTYYLMMLGSENKLPLPVRHMITGLTADTLNHSAPIQLLYLSVSVQF